MKDYKRLFSLQRSETDALFTNEAVKAIRDLRRDDAEMFRRAWRRLRRIMTAEQVADLAALLDEDDPCTEDVTETTGDWAHWS